MKHLTKSIQRLGRTERADNAVRTEPRPPDAASALPANGTSLAARTKGGSHGLGLWWTFTAALVLAAAIIVAIVQNGHHVRLHYLVWDVNVSLIVVVLTTALIAVFLDEVGGLIWRRRRRARLRRRSELEQLRMALQRPEEAPAGVVAPSARSVVPES
jgi:uncharacterized integral membrane protein